MESQYCLDETFLDTDPADAPQELRVVIVYDDVDAGQRAMRVLADLRKGMREDTEFQTLPWSFNLLADPEWGKVAASEGIGAEILMIATNGAEPLPPAVGRWVRYVVDRKRGTDAAVVALFGPEKDPDGVGSRRVEDLRGAARQAGLDFFAPAPQRERGEFATILHERAGGLADLPFPHRWRVSATGAPDTARDA